MAEIYFPNMSGTAICSCCRCFAGGRGEAFLVWWVISYLTWMESITEWLGGEFSSLHQNSFHHFRDFWCFDITTHQWDNIDTKIRPSARSGHRMAVWKHLIILFGGFYDPGIVSMCSLWCFTKSLQIPHSARYLNDLWVFDTQEYTWTQVELKETDSRPS